MTTPKVSVLDIERIFTKEGEHPYDTVNWEKRDVVQENWKTGETIFRQEGVEFPATWSSNASTIVTTKYFRGKVDTPEREWSLKQLIDRVVKTYVGAARKYKYITSPKKLEIFEHELTYLLLHQYFSFNSPVWFNVGTKSSQQVSACQPYDALVNTEDGDLPIGYIVENNMVGLKVRTASGVLTEVLAVKNNGVKNVLRITANDIAFEVTPDHLVWKATNKHNGEFVQAGTLKKGNQVTWHGNEKEQPTQLYTITNIDNTGQQTVYDIQTDTEEYLTNGIRVHNCFILSVDDSMDSILNWYREEGLIFKGGSGAGVNLSRLRSSKEILKNSGGTSSGPVSFMRGADASAGTIKSGGACLAPWTKVYTTENGPVSVEELAETNKDFTTVAYNPLLGRVQAVKARAWESGRKQLMRLETDKGIFTLSKDHPVLLMDGQYVTLENLQPGMSIRPGTITVNALGYQRIGLHDGQKGKESIHRLVAQDVLQFNIIGMEVHHKDHNPSNNSPENLEILTRSEHLKHHIEHELSNGTHPFLRYTGKPREDLSGDLNGMSFASGNRTAQYKANREEGMRRSNVYEKGAAAAQHQKMLNTCYKIANNGGSIETFDDYIEGRKKYIGRIPSITKLRQQINNRFGSYEKFIEEVRANNHTVVSLTALEESVVYDVEVDNDTPRDKSTNDGHNFLIITDEEKTQRKGLTGIFVSNTRRAAKMIVLDVDHPDIEEFVETKAHEEGKIRVLRDAGYDMDLGGKDIISVQYQNANNSVRVDDTFMNAVKDDKDYNLIARTTGDVVESVNAPSLFRKIAEAAWSCADPGIQYKDTINHWHTNKNTGPITASNPCSEFLSLDNSSCNLASLNLMKFRKNNGTFDYGQFIKVVELVFTAMDVSISFGDFPTEKIGEVTRAFRQIGIGYTNLGALLMSSGIGYDSREGRAYAAAITSLMSAVSYRRSAEIAGVVGPYDGFEVNKEPHMEVMDMHRAEANGLVSVLNGEPGGVFVEPGMVTSHHLANEIAMVANREWEHNLEIGEKNGWRNAQASLLAPTGTISFMMDSDTTGVEPDFSLVKFKKMVGGGSLQIVNSQVSEALRSLGYGEHIVKEIEEYILEHGNVEGAPGLAREHYDVFDCAVGERAISAMGHIKMMAAIQPFLSGALSKTINLPESATVEEIEEVYYRGWELGLKAIAVYRDNCKVGQPLSDGKAKKKNIDTFGANPQVVEKIVEKFIEKPARRKLPKKRSAETVSFTVGGSEGYLTAGLYEDGSIGELFVKMSKQGSTLAGIMDAFSIAVSLGLQHGVPLEAFVGKFTNMRFEPSGMTDDPDIRMAQSLVDYMFRRIALDHVSFDIRSEYGIYTTKERTAALNSENHDIVAMSSGDDDEDEPDQSGIAPPARGKLDVERAHESSLSSHSLKVEAPLCPNCGTASGMTKTGACWACAYCGNSTGCS